MKSIFVMGNPDSGKTAIVLGLALKFKELGYKVGYFKPVDNGRMSISGKVPGGDAILMKNELELGNSVGQMNPIKAGPDYLNNMTRDKNILEEIKMIYDDIAKNCDIVFVEGAIYPHALASLELDSATLARELGSYVITTVKTEEDSSLDMAVLYNRYLTKMQIPLLGTIFSNVPREMYSKVEGYFRPALEDSGFKTIGIIPERPEITYPTVLEYQEILGGKFLVGHEYTDRYVEDITIGAMTAESALPYLHRAVNQAVVMGGDRSDIATAALETQPSVMILTGGISPDPKILSLAEEKGVPVILTHQDTYKAAELLGKAFRHLKPGDEVGINIARENADQYCDWRYIIETIKL